jgi:hypothetical protein
VASGLHIQTNLRVIPGTENNSKNATFDHALAVDPNPPQCTLESCRCGARAKLFTPLLAAASGWERDRGRGAVWVAHHPRDRL